MRLAVVGSRGYNDYNSFKIILDIIIPRDGITCLVSGGAKGVDKLAERYAEEHNFPIDIYYADWENNGKAAGFIRNKVIWDNADCGLAIWDGQSKGTAHSFDLSKKLNKPLLIFNYKENIWQTTT